jgi:hypothetical protein
MQAYQQRQLWQEVAGKYGHFVQDQVGTGVTWSVEYHFKGHVPVVKFDNSR